MKKTTRNYLWVLVANFMLIGAIMVLWQVKLQYQAFAAPPVPVLEGDLAKMTILPDPKPLPSALYWKNFTDKADIADLKGQWTILNIWATWCPPCVTELPSLAALAAARQNDGLRVVAISVDSGEDIKEIAARIDALKAGDFARNWDHDNAVFTALNILALPSTYIIDPQGRIFATYMKDTDWMSADAQVFVDSLLTASK